MLGQLPSPEFNDHIPVTVIKILVVVKGRQEALIVEGIPSIKEGSRNDMWNARLKVLTTTLKKKCWKGAYW